MSFIVRSSSTQMRGSRRWDQLLARLARCYVTCERGFGTNSTAKPNFTAQLTARAHGLLPALPEAITDIFGCSFVLRLPRVDHGRLRIRDPLAPSSPASARFKAVMIPASLSLFRQFLGNTSPHSVEPWEQKSHALKHESSKRLKHQQKRCRFRQRSAV